MTTPQQSGKSAGQPPMSDHISEAIWRCGIVAKPKKNNPFILFVQQIAQELSDTLDTYTATYTISYRSPNFLIWLEDPHTQKQILSSPVLHTANFHFEVLPWSTEYETGTLPWIIDENPLAILPAIKKGCYTKASCALKDTFASMIGPHYELRAPDYSYLAIVELQSFYYAKFALFNKCREAATEALILLQNLASKLSVSALNKQRILSSMTEPPSSTNYRHVEAFLAFLNATAAEMPSTLPPIAHHINSVNRDANPLIDLTHFRDIPHFSEVPVPPIYVSRLKTIYATASKHIYGTEAILTTVQTGDQTYEAYVTVANMTSKYNDVPQKTQAAIETITIYNCLRYSTNVSGYQIVELNYPILSKVLRSMNKHAIDISILQSSALQIGSYTYEFLTELQNHKHGLQTLENQHVLTVINTLMDDIQCSCNSIIAAANCFMDFKVQFISMTLHTEPPATRTDRWLAIPEPLTIGNLP